MAKVTSLQELYVDELRDLWSANDQMSRALKTMSPHATNSRLKSLLEDAPQGITRHTCLLKALLDDQGAEVSKEHCKGMEGLVKEALKHTVDSAPPRGPVLDAALIAQYQRMTHYGITGFGTVAAFARALKLSGDGARLEAAVQDMHQSDDLMSELAEAAVNIDAADR